MHQREKVERAQSVKSRSQREKENFVKERKLRKPWRKAIEEERERNNVCKRN